MNDTALGAIALHLPDNMRGSIMKAFYTLNDRKYIRVHTNFPLHRHGILSMLGLPNSSDITRDQVQEAFKQWDASAFEEKAVEFRMCAFTLRTFDEWDNHPQGLAIKNEPPRKVSSLSSSCLHPLANNKLLDLSRVLAGPVAERTLAAHGADVLLVTSPNLPALPDLDVDTSQGKRTTQIDLTLAEDKEKLQRLIFDADVFLQAYRPGALEGKGFGTHEVFDSLVQTATGFNAAESQAYAGFQRSLVSLLRPKPFPVQALDHAAGYLLAYGVNVALCKTLTIRGWLMGSSLAAVAQWLRSLGRVLPEVGFGQAAKPMPSITSPPDLEVSDLSSEWGLSHTSSDGKIMTALKHAAILSETPVKEATAPISLNSSLPEWLPLSV
ncbi:CoA-transferase family III domain-containing protein [Lentinula aciculospora]|uniref:CoA-transferase family III domain-containing protein n=1 Tax=Lentinula aciculospora TaxID=153920 RepID=A0A9W9DR41_9AGAR|nr:CoA-transferase family III domain-containing protein [Lentinula aciculospora]